MSLSRTRLCLLFSLPLAFAACSRTKTDLAPLRERAEELRLQLAAEQKSISQMRLYLHQRDRVETELEVLLQVQTRQLATVLAELKGVQERFRLYQEDFRKLALASAPGKELGNVVINGQLFHGLVVKSLNERELVFRHADGAGRAAVESLPMAVKEKFLLVEAPLLLAARELPAPELLAQHVEDGPLLPATSLTELMGDIPERQSSQMTLLEMLFSSRSEVSPQIYRRQRGAVSAGFMGKCAN